MHYVSFLNRNIVHVHPVYKLFWTVQFSQHFVLLATVVSFNLLLSHALLSHEIGFVGEAGQHYFIATQVDQRVGEDVEYLSKYLTYQFVGFIQGHVQRTHKSSTESTGNSLVLRSQAPTCSMSWSI
jgi:hypothetical protein